MAKRVFDAPLRHVGYGDLSILVPLPMPEITQWT
jgi:hypothetical protein